METSLPTPFSARVYVNLLEGTYHGIPFWLFVVAMDAMAHGSTIYDDLLPVKDLLPIKHGDGLYVK